MAENEQKPEERKKSSKLLMMIIIVVLAFVLGGGGAAFFIMTMYDHGSGSDGQAQKALEQASKPVKTFYYNLSKPLIVDFPRDSSAQLIQVSLSFLVDGQTTLEALKKHDPMIRNNLLMLLSAEDPDSLNTWEGKDQLRTRILTEVGSVLTKMTGENHVKEVFFTAFVMQ